MNVISFFTKVYHVAEMFDSAAWHQRASCTLHIMAFDCNESLQHFKNITHILSHKKIISKLSVLVISTINLNLWMFSA